MCFLDGNSKQHNHPKVDLPYQVYLKRFRFHYQIRLEKQIFIFPIFTNSSLGNRKLYRSEKRMIRSTSRLVNNIPMNTCDFLILWNSSHIRSSLFQLNKTLSELEECRNNLSSCLEENARLRRYFVNFFLVLHLEMLIIFNTFSPSTTEKLMICMLH